MTPRPPRKAIPLKAQLHAALYQLGFEPHEVELDHDPALGLRPIDPETGEHIPHQHDPKCLIWRPKAEHKFKTNGRKGESNLSITGNGDKSRIDKCDRVEPEHREFQRRLLSVEAMAEHRETKTSKWPKQRIPHAKRKPRTPQRTATTPPAKIVRRPI